MELKISGLSKTYPNGVAALRDVSLTIPAGMFGLLGPNGAGKSTLMRTLATLQEPDTGTATLDGLDIIKDKDATRRLLGYLPQEFGLYPKVQAWALLDHFAILKGIRNRSERNASVEALLKRTNLWEARKRKLGTFSGGMKQRFGIAQALLGEPRLIIVDEPTAGLDPEERVRFHNLLAEIGEQVVVILSTHIVDDVSDLCARMAIIGRVWKRLADKSEAASLGQRLPVISTRRLAGKLVVRVLSDAAPDPSFEAAPPELEDVYFQAIHASVKTAAPVAA
jgi:ABC-2 type transport system ATP-binding protein